MTIGIGGMIGGLVSLTVQGSAVSAGFSSLLKGESSATSETSSERKEAKAVKNEGIESMLEGSIFGFISSLGAVIESEIGTLKDSSFSSSSKETEPKSKKVETGGVAFEAKDFSKIISSTVESLGGIEGIISTASKIASVIPTGSPVALDLDGSGMIETTGSSTAKDRAAGQALGRTVDFDLDGDGSKESIEWMAGNGDGLLVDNRDGGAATDMSGSRLFGDEGGQYGNGYNKMATLDNDGDSKLSGQELDGLEIWIDDGDAVVEEGELKALSEFDISELSTKMNSVSNDNGESLMRSHANNGSIMTEDVWFGIKDT